MRYYESKPEESWAENNDELNNKPQPLNKSQKIAVATLAFFALFVIIFWAYSFKNSLTQPFNRTSDQQTTVETRQGASQENSEEALRNKDTDNDGLSDWDELYFYKTSPYLEDSDSDGLSDKAEIDTDKDPNCPVGRDCYSSGLVDGQKTVNSGTEDQGESLNELLNQLNNLTQSGANESNVPSEQALESLMSGEVDAATLRQILLDYGMDRELLDQISDEELINGFQEILNE